jgi:hypothetical protein
MSLKCRSSHDAGEKVVTPCREHGRAKPVSANLDLVRSIYAEASG